MSLAGCGRESNRGLARLRRLAFLHVDFKQHCRETEGRCPAVCLIYWHDVRRKGRAIFAQERQRMVTVQLEQRGIKDPRLLQAMRKVPREIFVPLRERCCAYDDGPLPIGREETISQPYVVAFMLERLQLEPADRVLEVGTGSGYQTALLAELCAEVFSVEVNDELAGKASRRLRILGYRNVRVSTADGNLGWAEFAPFQKIILSAACRRIPRALVDQLSSPGRMILPLGVEDQYLVLMVKGPQGLTTSEHGAVRFVKMKGQDAL